MKKLPILLLTLAMSATTTIPTQAADYSFGTGGDSFVAGTPTSGDYSITLDRPPMTENTRRNKDAAYFALPFGVFSGEIPTDPTSPYHNNLPTGGFVSLNQNLPAVGNETYAVGNSSVNVLAQDISAGSFLSSTSQTDNLKTAPLYNDDGTIGTLSIPRFNKTIKVYEGETIESMKSGVGHFSYTSAWDGNVGLAGHNRGNSAYFDFVKDLSNGDTIKYKTPYGTRSYKIFSKTIVSDTDTSSLSWSEENIITLITCVADKPSLRYVVQAREI